MKRSNYWRLPALALALFAAMPALAAPSVLATVKPLHSLVAGVMAGVGKPELLLRGAASPHSYSLRPSDAVRLQHAEVIFWIGPILETFLNKPLAALGGRAHVVELAVMPGVSLLNARTGGLWEDEEEGEADTGALSGKDEHFWLDPENAKAMVRVIVASLSEADPADAEAYRRNGEALTVRIEALDRTLAGKLAPVQGRPFIVFHDAYQYFEKRYGLMAVGSITVHPENQPGARRVGEVRRKIAASGAACVFSETQFEPGLVRTLIAGTKAGTAALDEIGSDLPEGPDQYFAMMTRLADRLESCLETGKK